MTDNNDDNDDGTVVRMGDIRALKVLEELGRTVDDVMKQAEDIVRSDFSLSDHILATTVEMLAEAERAPVDELEGNFDHIDLWLRMLFDMRSALADTVTRRGGDVPVFAQEDE